MVDPTMRLSGGGARNRRMARILGELFGATWIQTFDSGRINIEIDVGDRRRMEELIAAYNRSVKYDYGMKERSGRDVYDVTIE